MTATVRLEFAASVATLVLARPPLNALSLELIDSIQNALDQVAAAGVHILRIRSDVGAFCAGADLAAVGAIMGADDPGAEMRRFVEAFHALNNRLAGLGAITIAEIEGAALGGGLELAMACDFRIATERARLGLPETKLGLIPAAGGTFRLREIAGLAVARRLILTGETLRPDDALACGIVDAVLRGTEEEIRSGFEQFAGKTAGNGKAALLAAKRCLSRPPQEGQAAEIAEISALVTDTETQARVNSFLKT